MHAQLNLMWKLLDYDIRHERPGPHHDAFRKLLGEQEADLEIMSDRLMKIVESYYNST